MSNTAETFSASFVRRPSLSHHVGPKTVPFLSFYGLSQI